MGILTYYVAPWAFMYGNYQLFFLILNFVLIIMILGLAFLSIILLPYLQLLLLNIYLFCIRRDRKLYKVVKKNLEGHEKRNTKTALMFTIALSFLIFAGSTFELISHLMISDLESIIGADLYASSQASSNYLDEGAIIGYLE